MRAFVIDKYAHPSQIHLKLDAPDPNPGPNDVLVDIYSAGLNFFDLLQAQGKYQVQPPFPFILGAEFAGKIAESSPIPKGCPYKPGDRVFGSTQGAYADKIAVSWKVLVPLSQTMSFDQGAGLFLTWPTSYEALVGRAELKAGEWVLILAAAGGVGLAAVQISKALGAKVIAAAGSPSKLSVAQHHGGADYVVDYTKPDWHKEVLKITNGKGADVVYDPVGRIRESLKCIAWKGRAVVVGFAGGEIEKLPLNLVLLKNIAITGIHWGAYVKNEPSRIPIVWKELLELFNSSRLKPVVYETVYPLEDLQSGLYAIETRKTWGKAIVRVKDSDSDTDGTRARL